MPAQASGVVAPLTILLAGPRGFCAGVDRAILIVERALERYGAPVYVRHEIVHNRHVVEALERKGAVFVAELDQVPDDRPVVFSAHGVPKSVPAEAQRREMIYLDATCPLVSKVHSEAEHHRKAGRHIALIGHAGHPEVVGTMGQLPEGSITLVEDEEQARSVNLPAGPLAYATQTTLSVDDTAGIVAELMRRFPDMLPPRKDDICYATTNRQAAVKAIAARSDAVLVIGSTKSSNSLRLVEVAKRAGCANAYLVASAADIDWAKLGPIRTLGLSAGASAPEILVQETIDEARKRFAVTIEDVVTATEDVKFNLPRALETA
ncbi:MAG: 4-hydroxy-3-methylbut-2-enyl diphosphate reductase [Alphaproteobacteria bacterium]|nr:4-hydroxy-3-methylbut-2-enyl diphosphate reductase [Alphaproteobacteria bacterium]MCA0451368.1 4-hydroxy-3-methylbut-2-enyl diphosphate reductase [Pseudomonadota bacterium]